MTFKFTPVTEQDRAAFIAFHHHVYRDVVERRFGWDEAEQDKFATESFNQGRLQWWIVEGVRVGVVRWIDHSAYIQIDEIMLAPDYQGRGLAAKIIAYVRGTACAAGKEVRAQTIHKDRSRALFERMGFIVTGETETHWQLMIPSPKA